MWFRDRSRITTDACGAAPERPEQGRQEQVVRIPNPDHERFGRLQRIEEGRAAEHRIDLTDGLANRATDNRRRALGSIPREVRMNSGSPRRDRRRAQPRLSMSRCRRPPCASSWPRWASSSERHRRAGPGVPAGGHTEGRCLDQGDRPQAVGVIGTELPIEFAPQRTEPFTSAPRALVRGAGELGQDSLRRRLSAGVRWSARAHGQWRPQAAPARAFLGGRVRCSVRILRLDYKFAGPDFVGETLEVRGRALRTAAGGRAIGCARRWRSGMRAQAKSRRSGPHRLARHVFVCRRAVERTACRLRLDASVEAGDEAVPEGVRELLGREDERLTSFCALDASRLRLFADAVSGLRPWHYDARAAAAVGLASAVAPDLFPIHAIEPEPGTLPPNEDSVSPETRFSARAWPRSGNVSASFSRRMRASDRRVGAVGLQLGRRQCSTAPSAPGGHRSRCGSWAGGRQIEILETRKAAGVTASPARDHAGAAAGPSSLYPDQQRSSWRCETTIRLAAWLDPQHSIHKGLHQSSADSLAADTGAPVDRHPAAAEGDPLVGCTRCRPR